MLLDLILSLVPFAALMVGIWGALTFRRRRRRRSLPSGLADARAWLRDEQRRAMREWDAEFRRLQGLPPEPYAFPARSISKRGIRIDTLTDQANARRHGQYDGPVDGVPGPMLMRALQQRVYVPQPLWVVRDVNGLSRGSFLDYDEAVRVVHALGFGAYIVTHPTTTEGEPT